MFKHYNEDCKPWMDPQREIWFLRHRSYPEEKSGERAPDPIPK